MVNGGIRAKCASMLPRSEIFCAILSFIPHMWWLPEEVVFETRTRTRTRVFQKSRNGSYRNDFLVPWYIVLSRARPSTGCRCHLLGLWSCTFHKWSLLVVCVFFSLVVSYAYLLLMVVCGRMVKTHFFLLKNFYESKRLRIAQKFPCVAWTTTLIEKLRLTVAKAWWFGHQHMFGQNIVCFFLHKTAN